MCSSEHSHDAAQNSPHNVVFSNIASIPLQSIPDRFPALSHTVSFPVVFISKFCCDSNTFQINSFLSLHNSLQFYIEITHISDELTVQSMTFYLYELELISSRECVDRINIYNHHIVYGNGLDKLVCWFMLQFLYQKSLLMLVAVASAKLAMISGKPLLTRSHSA